MNAPLWVSAAAGLVLELVRDLLGDLRRQASEAAIDDAATRISRAVLSAPFEKLAPEAHAEAHALMANTLVASLASLAGLSDKNRKRLRDRVGRKLMRGAADQLDDALDDLAKKRKKWAKALKL